MRLTADKKQFARAVVLDVEEKQRYVRVTAVRVPGNRAANCTADDYFRGIRKFLEGRNVTINN